MVEARNRVRPYIDLNISINLILAITIAIILHKYANGRAKKGRTMRKLQPTEAESSQGIGPSTTARPAMAEARNRWRPDTGPNISISFMLTIAIAIIFHKYANWKAKKGRTIRKCQPEEAESCQRIGPKRVTTTMATGTCRTMQAMGPQEPRYRFVNTFGTLALHGRRGISKAQQATTSRTRRACR